MRKIIVLSMITLDGVIQGPGGPGEDPEYDFEYGGWVAPFSDDVYNEVVQKELGTADYLLGRKTFDIWENYWPKHREQWPGISEGMKYIMSNTRNTTDWENTTFLQGVEDIKKLKESDGRDLHVWGSSEIIQLLLKHNLVDELKLKIHPLTLGKGKKLFDDEATPAAFTLTEHIVTPKGVIIAYYKRAGDVETGQAGA